MTARILTVDDSATMRQLIASTLRCAGYQVVDRADGVEALEFAACENVDLALVDVNMPRMDGITLVGKLRQLHGYRHTPLLMLTTESSAEKKAQAKQAGASGWIVKPFNPNSLVTTLAKLLGSNASRG
jgi:two-component system chemotaxis response regulator CheY